MGASKLSKREREIIELATQGLLDKQICDELGLSFNTISTYWRRIRQKLGDAPRAALVGAYIADKVKQQHGEQPPRQRGHSIIVDARTRMSLASDDINARQDFPLGEHRPFSDYAGLLHPDDQPMAIDAMERLFRGEQDVVHLVFREIGPRAIQTINATFFALRDESGKVKWVYAQGLDKANVSPEERTGFLRGTWVRDAPSREMRYDEGMAKIMGVEGPGLITIDEVHKLIVAEQVEELTALFAKVVEQRKEEFSNDFFFRGLDGALKRGRMFRRLKYHDDGTMTIYGELTVFD